jgi:hypothetical protein
MTDNRESLQRAPRPKFVWVLFSGLLVSSFGCNRSGPPVEVVAPDQFTGPVFLILDEHAGVEIPFREGTYVVEIPPNGRLRVRSLAPFQGWHKETWRYASGEVLLDANLVQNPDPDKVMKQMQNAGVSNGVTHLEAFIGTRAQLLEFIRGPRPSLD